FATCVPAPPRKLIWVLGDASGVPGIGETVIGLAAAVRAAASLSTAVAAVEAPPHALRAAGTTAQATQTSARTLCRLLLMWVSWLGRLAGAPAWGGDQCSGRPACP